MAKTYQVRVTNEFRSSTTSPRQHAGLTIPTDGNGYVGELTDEQLKAFQEDQYVLVTEPGSDEVKTVKKSQAKKAAATTVAVKNATTAKKAAKADAAGTVERKEIDAQTGPKA